MKQNEIVETISPFIFRVGGSVHIADGETPDVKAYRVRISTPSIGQGIFLKWWVGEDREVGLINFGNSHVGQHAVSSVEELRTKIKEALFAHSYGRRVNG